MTPVAGRQPASPGYPVLRLGCVVLALAAALVLALVLPLGAGEARALNWLQSVAAPGIGWGEPFRHLIARAAAADRPLVTLTAAAVVLKLVPAIGALFALRLPGILAAGLISASLARLAGSRATALLSTMLFVASPVLWAAVVGTPGLLVDGAAVITLYAQVRVAEVRPAPGPVLIALLALAVLIGNGAGVYAIAVGLGAWLHAGLTRGQWRLFGSLRLTVLAGLTLAGLTLVNVIGLPAWGRWMALIRELTMAIERSGLPMPAWIVAVIAIVPSLIALVAGMRRPAGAPGRLTLILAIGALVLATAVNTPALACVALAPIMLLWWTAPLRATGQRYTVLWIAGFYALAAVAAVCFMLIHGRGEPASDAVLMWVSRGLAGVLAMAAIIGIGRAWRGRGAAPATAVALALASVIAAGALWLAAPQQLLSQRSYDRQLAADLGPLARRPIAALTPVGSALWRAQLGRPVFVAHDLPALCRWAAAQSGDRAPLALVRPAATDPVLGRFRDAQLLLQSPGTPRTSVMVIELDGPALHGCKNSHCDSCAEAGKSRQTG